MWLPSVLLPQAGLLHLKSIFFLAAQTITIFFSHLMVCRLAEHRTPLDLRAR